MLANQLWKEVQAVGRDFVEVKTVVIAGSLIKLLLLRILLLLSLYCIMSWEWINLIFVSGKSFKNDLFLDQ